MWILDILAAMGLLAIVFLPFAMYMVNRAGWDSINRV